LLTVKLDDNWGEVSLGAGYNVTDSVHAFIDIVTSFDGDIDQKWRVNFGGRYVF
jgi:outer membrane autotransporter protein